MFFILHILLMVTAILGVITGIAFAVFFRKKKNWLKIHKTINSLGSLTMAAGFLMVFIYVSGSSGEHINGLHQAVGLMALMCVGIALLLGFHQFRAKNKPAVRTAHRFIGRLSLVTLITAVILGLKLINII
ncbi:MAG: hypothetical protein QMD11_04020 [Smithella sp.]|nr:hypothetical protein [Smithella sp.]